MMLMQGEFGTIHHRKGWVEACEAARSSSRPPIISIWGPVAEDDLVVVQGRVDMMVE